MTTWGDAPKIQGPPQTSDISVLLDYVKKLANTTAKMAKDLEFILNGNVAFDNIQAEGIRTDNLQAGSVIAEKIDVDQLSAISADLGTIVAGAIYGAYIATSRGAYPFVELSNTDNLLGARKGPDNFVQMYSPVDRLSPVLRFNTNGADSYIFYDPSDNKFSFTSNDADINISANGVIELYAQEVRVISWDSLINNTTGKSLAEELGL